MQDYENLLGMSQGMLIAARNAQWDQLVRLEQDCRGVVDRLLASEVEIDMSEPNRRRRAEIIRRVLADDAEIRDLADPTLARSNRFLSGHFLERRLGPQA